MMKLQKILHKKRVFFIPIYSMRSHKTNLYNLQNDGNFARVMYKIKKSNCSATVLVPQYNKLTDSSKIIINYYKTNFNVNFIESNFYGESAYNTRSNTSLNIDNKLLNGFDYFVLEPNSLPQIFYNEFGINKNQIIYWCPVSFIPQNNQAEFLKQFYDIDKNNAKLFKTFVCSKLQKDSLNGNTFVDLDVFDNKQYEPKIIFLPFRLSDPGYHIKDICKVLQGLLISGYDFNIYYTDPNDTFNDIFGNFPELVNKTIKIPSEKSVYYSILKSKPIIPILEDLDSILHQNIFEFNKYKCTTILFNGFNRKFYTSKSIRLNNICDLEEAFISCLK